MIKFHKVSGKPAKVESGDENIWFSYPNGIYVADNQGNPRLISPGKMVGDAVPVGVPNEPGLFYYNRSNKKIIFPPQKNGLKLAPAVFQEQVEAATSQVMF